MLRLTFIFVLLLLVITSCWAVSSTTNHHDPRVKPVHKRQRLHGDVAERNQEIAQKRQKIKAAAAHRQEKTTEEIRRMADEARRETMLLKEELDEAIRTGRRKDGTPHDVYDPFLDHRRHQEMHMDHDIQEEAPEKPFPPEPIQDLGRVGKTFRESLIATGRWMAVYVYSSGDDCDNCKASLLEDFKRAANFHADDEWVHSRRDRQLSYGYLDAAQNRSVWEQIKAFHPMDEVWTLPIMILLHSDHSGHSHEYPHIVNVRHSHADDREGELPTSDSVNDEVDNVNGNTFESQFYRDCLHWMYRARHATAFQTVGTEEHLMNLIYNTTHDGIVVVLMHDNDVLQHRGRVSYFFSQVMEEERWHLQFAVFRNAAYWQSDDAKQRREALPDQSWRLKYNPNDEADVLAFQVDEEDPDAFVVHPYTFPRLSSERTEWTDRNGFRLIHDFRKWVDHMKTKRHDKSNRRFHGVRGRYTIHHSGTEKEHCSSPIFNGDKVRVDYIGKETDSGRVFVNRTNEVLTAGDVVAHLPPYMHNFMLGWCENTRHEVFSPAHEGFHAEQYIFTIHDVVERLQLKSAEERQHPPGRREHKTHYFSADQVEVTHHDDL